MTALVVAGLFAICALLLVVAGLFAICALLLAIDN